MTALLGVDSSQPPTLTQAEAAKRAGVTWWGGYLGGSWHPVPWPSSAWAALKQAGITPVPIWVPKMWQDNPVTAAEDAISALKGSGLPTEEIVLDTEAAEERMMSPAQVKAWVDAWNRTLAQAGYTSVVYDGAYNYHGTAVEWLPLWNGRPTAAQATAHQYQGNTSRFGLPVDLDVASPTFTLSAVHAPKPITQTRIVASPQELLDMAESLVDARLEIAGIHQRTEEVATELSGIQQSSLGRHAAAHVAQALMLLGEIDGSGTGGLAHTRGAVFQAEAVCRHTRGQLLRADKTPSGGAGIRVAGSGKPATPTGGAPLGPPAPPKKTPPKSGSDTTILA